MLQIRKDPIKNNRIAIATLRQNRTFFPRKDYCPLCPTKNKNISTEIPGEDYNIVVFENKFPTFSRTAENIEYEQQLSIYKTEQSKGICEVVCYSSDHKKNLEDLHISKIENLIKVWADRYYFIGSKDYIKYVYIFENKGKEVGVTLSHPHGQIYGFPYIPRIALDELKSSKRYFLNNKRCIHCDLINNEISKDERVIIKNNDFCAFVPFFARFPYEVHVYPLRHLGSLCEINKNEISSLAEILKELIVRFNMLFNFRMPYVMAIHQNPTNGKNYDYYHFHFEFYSLYRTKNKLKYLAGCELGMDTFINDVLPEESAQTLKNINLKNNLNELDGKSS